MRRTLLAVHGDGDHARLWLAVALLACALVACSPSDRKGGVNARVGVGSAGAGVEKTKGHQALSKAVVKQTAASEFDRLHTALDKAGLPIYDVIDDKPANLSIARKEIIEVDARLRVSGMETVRELFGLFSKVAMPASRTSSTGTSPNG